VRWVKDTSCRFYQRPHYTLDELDQMCEQMVTSSLRDRHGQVSFPITTDDLQVMIEQHVDDLDMYADLSGEGGDVEGATLFYRGKRPRVRISSALSSNPSSENRLRTTLTHEYGHVRLHTMMFEIDTKPASLFPSEEEKPQVNRCHRDKILNASQYDWMEWQAGYACGALLMPISALMEAVNEFKRGFKMLGPAIQVDSPEAEELFIRVSQRFQASREAARVRLLKRQIVLDGVVQAGGVLFE